MKQAFFVMVEKLISFVLVFQTASVTLDGECGAGATRAGCLHFSFPPLATEELGLICPSQSASLW